MEILEHHIKSEPCTTRPAYRDGKTPKSVKVYSCAMESKYLLVTNIPSLNLDSSLVKLFATYGTIEEHRPLHEYPTEQFCDVYLIKFFKIQNARCAKIKLDNYGFFGGILHVCYAPEYESLDDLRDKINERNFIVSVKCKKYEAMGYGTLEHEIMSKASPQISFKTKKVYKEKWQKKKNSYWSKDKGNKVIDANEECPMVKYPQLPDNWLKKTDNGEASYEETTHEINKKLKQTIPHQQSINIGKRKKTVNL